MAAVVADRGVGDATVARVVARSGVSRRTFYELFVDREECFLATFDQAIERIAAVVVPAYLQPSKWRERVRAGLTALLQLLDSELGLGRLVIVETLGAGPRTLEHRQRLLATVIGAIDQGRNECRDGQGPPPLTAEGVVGGALSLIHTRLIESGDVPLTELVNPLTSMIVLPYLGSAAARRELDRPVAKPDRPVRQAGLDPLRDLGMRLTYRTTCVLLAVGAHPGASNRRIAELAEISDQGQISKLLARLEHLGLIHNGSDPAVKGMPNAWMLTRQGASLRDALSVGTPMPVGTQKLV
jgi:AcrR family transcriptional regulator